MKYEGQTFTTPIELDGNVFKDCVFKTNVTYRGGNFEFAGTWDFREASLTFADEALATLNFLRILRRVAGKEFVERMLAPPMQ